jgi:two-component system phosphate regulon sensor histidine kinase PhoR
LLDNAIKYNRPAGQIFVAAGKTSDGYQITVTDSGRGILADEQARIFERFYRVDKSRQRRDETTLSGAGLGLSIAQWIAEIHRAKIELASSGEDGSTFLITFSLS